MKASESFAFLPSNRGEADTFAEKLIGELMDGELDPLRFKIFLKVCERWMSAVKEQADRLALEEAEKYGKSFELLGAKCAVKEAAARYDFSGCGHPAWERYKSDEQAAVSHRKEIEETLKSLRESINIVDKETGEVLTVSPPVKSSTTIVEVRL